jgi:hypothetical protein
MEQNRGDMAIMNNEIFVVGSTMGNVDGSIQQGGGDAFVARFDADGNIIETNQFGTSEKDEARSIYNLNFHIILNAFQIQNSSICVNQGSGDLYITGFTFGNFGGGNAGNSDAFVAKFTTMGTSFTG